MTSLKVLVVEEFDSDKLLEHSLLKQGYQVVSIKLSQSNILETVHTSQPDVMVLSVYIPSEKLLSMIIDINQKRSIPVIMFAEDHQTTTINKVIKAGVSAYVVDGLEAKRIKTIIDIAIVRFKEHQALKDELQKTKNQLEDRKTIDRAKAILIKSQGYTEEEAYHTLRKLAMDRHVVIGEMAKNVIAMAGLFK